MNAKKRKEKLEKQFKNYFGAVPQTMVQLQELFIKKNIPGWDQGYWIEKFQELQEAYNLLEHIEERGLADIL